MSYSSTILADSPLVYWKLDETTGATQFADSSGNNRIATIGGTPTYSTASKVDTGSVGFSSTQYGYTANSPAWLSSTNTYTVEVWFATTAGGSRALVMFDQSSHGPGASDRFFMFYLSNGAVIFNPFNSGGGYVTLASPTATYNDGIWHHAVGTWDGTTVKLYVDGSLVSSVSLTGTSPTGVGAPIVIGAGCNNGLGNYLPYSGSLDEIAIYGTTLNGATISAHFSAGLANFSPSNARVETTYLESMATGTKTAQIEANYVEAMTIVQPAQVETVYVQTLLSTTPPIQAESNYVQALLITTPPVQSEVVYVEALVLPVASAPRYVGWGVQR